MIGATLFVGENNFNLFWRPKIYQNDPKKSQFAWNTSLLKFLSNAKYPSLHWLKYGEKYYCRINNSFSLNWEGFRKKKLVLSINNWLYNDHCQIFRTADQPFNMLILCPISHFFFKGVFSDLRSQSKSQLSRKTTTFSFLKSHILFLEMLKVFNEVVLWNSEIKCGQCLKQLN